MHVSKQIKVVHDEDGFPNRSPKKIDSVAQSTTEDPMGRPEIKYSTGAKNPDESSAEILALAYDDLLECKRRDEQCGHLEGRKKKKKVPKNSRRIEERTTRKTANPK